MTTCRGMRPSVGFLHTVGVVTLLAAGTYGAGRVEVPDPSIMLPLVPTAAQAGAPACIKPGTRLTYFGRTASIPGEYKRLVQDDNGKWIDRNTGKRYDEEDVPSAASEAFNVIQVGYVGSGVAQLSTKLYILDMGTGKYRFAVGGGLVGHAGCAADYWIHPDVLKQVREVKEQGMRIIRMPYSLNGKVYKAIRFQTDDAAGYQAKVYDLETGLMIYYGSRTQGPAVNTAPLGGSGQAGVGQGSTQIVSGWIVEITDIDVPWKNAAPPAWTAQFRKLSYRGVQRSVVAAAGTKLDRTMTAVVTPKARADGWVRFSNHIALESLPGMRPEEAVQEGASGAASIAGLWIAPEALARLRPGQVIETNQRVGISVTVAEVKPGLVTLSEIGPLHRIDSAYDTKTGILSALTQTQQIGLASMVHSLRLVGQQ
jgi:hypothetical protein